MLDFYFNTKEEAYEFYQHIQNDNEEMKIEKPHKVLHEDKVYIYYGGNNEPVQSAKKISIYVLCQFKQK